MTAAPEAFLPSTREPRGSRRDTPARLRTPIGGLLLAALTAMPGSPAASDPELLARLQQGGLVIVVIATASGPAPQDDPPPMPACRPGTRLTPAGWQAALALGVGLRKQRVAVEVAHAGPGCAARHTAYLVFGADRVRHDAGLAASCDAPREERGHRRDALAARLATRPPFPGTHAAVVVDRCNLRDLAADGWPACARDPAPGDLVLFEPERNGSEPPLGCIPHATVHGWSRRPE